MCSVCVFWINSLQVNRLTPHLPVLACSDAGCFGADTFCMVNNLSRIQDLIQKLGVRWTCVFFLGSSLAVLGIPVCAQEWPPTLTDFLAIKASQTRGQAGLSVNIVICYYRVGVPLFGVRWPTEVYCMGSWEKSDWAWGYLTVWPGVWCLKIWDTYSLLKV